MHAGIQHRHSFNGSSCRVLAASHSAYDSSSRVSFASAISKRFTKEIDKKLQVDNLIHCTQGGRMQSLGYGFALRLVPRETTGTRHVDF